MVEFSVVMPCLNEEKTLGICIKKARVFFEAHDITYEIVVADNGSDDRSVSIAQQAGTRVIPVEIKGYGSALISGIREARGLYVIMGDADDSYDFSNLLPFVESLRQGNDMVIGNRFLGGIEPDAMPFLNKYLGNPVLSFFGRLFFHIPIRDFHCGLRGFNREKLLALKPVCMGMEFASEIIVKAALKNLKISEVPTKLHKDGRGRPPHLRRWRDGWRHLRFLLMFSPEWLFLYPGLILLATGISILFALRAGILYIGHVGFDVHTMLYGSAFTIIGLQMLTLSHVTRQLGRMYGFWHNNPLHEHFYKRMPMEYGLALGTTLFLLGIIWSVYITSVWTILGFTALDAQTVMRSAIPAVTLIITGFQVGISSFFTSVLLSLTDNHIMIEESDHAK